MEIDDPLARPVDEDADLPVLEPLPKGWVDPVLLERIETWQVSTGVVRGLRPVQRRTVIAYLSQQGWAVDRIAARVGTTENSVTRVRKYLRSHPLGGFAYVAA